MKKRIIFMLINMNIGGTEKALLNMLSEMPEDTYDITLLLLEKYGGFLNSIPSGVRVEYVEGYEEMKEILEISPQKHAIQLFRKGKLVKGINLVLLHLISKVKRERSLFYKYILKDYPVMKNEYDVAVAYAGPMDFISYFVVHKIRAKKKIQWIHFDITKIGFNKEFASKIYKGFDKIFVVSDEGRKKLLASLPTLRKKTEVFSNIVSADLINQLAKGRSPFDDDFDGIRILTVGRLSIEKGQDLAIKVVAKLLREGYKVKWYCLGDGHYRQQYKKMTKEYKVEDYFILLGTNPNPYPYIMGCDIYVQPSRHEGYCITLAEARALNKSIVTTNFTGAEEQIRNGETGLIVHVHEDEIYKGIIKLINDKELREKFESNLARQVSNSTLEMEKFYSVLY